MTYSGIEINEVNLLITNISFTFILTIAIAATVWGFFVFFDKRDKKTKEVYKKLKIKAENDPYAKKKFEKMKRKRFDKKDIWLEIFICCLLLFAIIVPSFFYVIPGWTDYVIKDYLIYDGEFTVCRGNRHKYIILENGTELTGGLGFDEGIHNGTIVYSQRSKITLGKKEHN